MNFEILMSRHRPADHVRPPAEFLSVRQVAEALSCDRGTVYSLIERGELLGVKPFHENGVIRIPLTSYEAYCDRVIGAAEHRAECRRSPSPAQPPSRRKIRIAAATPEHRTAVEFLRARGAFR